MSGHHVPLHQRSDGADVPQSLVEGKQLGGEVQRGQAAAGAAQSALVLTGQRGDGAAQQSVRLHGRAEEWVGVLGTTQETK